MKNSRKTRFALLSSVVALLVCFAMLLGATYAWFTDTVTSTGNKIEAGTLKVDLQLLDKNGNWDSLKAENDPIWDAEANKLWEPGYVDVKIFKIVNDGTLALKWKAAFTSEEELSILADVIEVYVMPWGVLTDEDAKTEVAYPAGRDLTGYTKVGTLREFVNNISSTTYGRLEAYESAYLGIALKMLETADNNYQGKTIGEFDIHIIATQEVEEGDSVDNKYDENATYPLIAGRFYTASAPVTTDANGAVAEETVVGNAIVPVGVQLESGVSELTLNQAYVAPSKSEAVIEATAGELITRMDIHVDGVSSNNTKPIIVPVEREFPKGLTANNISLVHVENGITVPMVAVNSLEELDAHNEFYYDPATGKVTVAMATFSEVVATVTTLDEWDGTVADAFNGGTGTADDPYIIATAEQFAYFRNQVDDGNTFAGQYVRLDVNIDLANINFDPIGWGYDYADYNVGDVAGKPFKGTFDGNNMTIHNLYQNGWDLESATGIDYTYTNCGGGLFAAACDATIKNLTIDGAQVTFECVEIGIVVGLAQGNCTFENITVRNSKIANYQRPAGGVVGEVSPAYNGSEWYGTHTFTNVTIEPTVVVGSLWGDFDAPVGGVIGARWDDADVSKVVMNNVDVAARLDVYNDVTSTYQWYAYRRAGMLIGNTDTPPANGKDSAVATAPFLTCTNVKVSYGDWVHYHYCEFSNHNSSWPWVRVEAGENCSAYSNPRYGVPNDVNGNKVVNENHVHADGDECMVELTFNQLYGGGQGVYGQSEHAGVSTYIYKIIYVYQDNILDTVYVTDNTVDVSVTNTALEDDIKNQPRPDGAEFAGWVNTGSVPVKEIPAGNTKNVLLYPDWASVHTARFVDENGNVIYEEEFVEGATSLTSVPSSPPSSSDYLQFEYWEVRAQDGTSTKWSDYQLKNAKSDITVYPYYSVIEAEGTISMNAGPDADGDGKPDYYTVDAASGLSGEVTIPGEINGVPVTVITDLSDDMLNTSVTSIIVKEGVQEIGSEAFAMTSALKTVTIPASVTSIGSNAFANSLGGGISDVLGGGKVITITYAGTWEQWLAVCENGWDSGIAKDSKVICAGDNSTYVKTGRSWNTGENYWEKQ